MRAPGHIRGRVYSPAARRILTDYWLHFLQGQRKNDVKFRSYPLLPSGSEACRTVASIRSSNEVHLLQLASKGERRPSSKRVGARANVMTPTPFICAQSCPEACLSAEHLAAAKLALGFGCSPVDSIVGKRKGSVHTS